MDDIFDVIPPGCGLSPLATRVLTALLANARAWVAAGNPPLDPADLSHSEQHILLGGPLPGQNTPGKAPAEPASASEPADATPEPPAAPRGPVLFSREYKPGEEVPLNEALAVMAANRSSDEQDLADEVMSRVAPVENQTLAAWKPLRAQMTG